jgi:hypothetical protein
MSRQAGLSFEQAPPFSLPLRFFLTAPLFLLAASTIIMISPEALASRWTPQALALTHALTLGFLAMVMLGALIQMLPVLAGSPLPAPRAVARVSHVTLATGTVALMSGFLLSSPQGFGTGLILLAGGFIVFLAAAARSLLRAPGGVTISGIRLSVISLAMTVTLGITLALFRAGVPNVPMIGALGAAHVTFGLVGWVLLLVIGVALQVVPMFQMTPPYPPPLSRWLAWSVFALLLLHAFPALLPTLITAIVDAGLAVSTLLFAFVTLSLQARRRRKLPDVTLDFWRLGMLSLIACVVVRFVAPASPKWAESQAYPLLLGVTFIGGFAVSVVMGMLYKIVPFLAWFHLQAQLQAHAGKIPNMKQILNEKMVRGQFRLHLAACLLLALSTVWPRLLHIPAGIALALSSVLLLANLLSAVRRYLRHGGRLS